MYLPKNYVLYLYVDYAQNQQQCPLIYFILYNLVYFRSTNPLTLIIYFIFLLPVTFISSSRYILFCGSVRIKNESFCPTLSLPE